MTGTPTRTQQFAAKARLSGVPEHCIDGLVRYVVDGIKPGNFLQAVLRDSLTDAASYADDVNRGSLFAYAVFLRTYAPSGCWGSADAVRGWEGIDAMEVTHGDGTLAWER